MSLRASLPVLLTLLLASPLLAGPARFLPWDETVGKQKFALSSAGKQTDLPPLHPLMRSKALPVTGTPEAPPMIVAKDKIDPATGKAAMVELKIPADVQSPLVLLLPDDKSPAGVKPFVVEDNTARFSWGTIRHLNATGKDLVTKIDGKVAVLPAGWTPVDINLSGAARNVGVETALKAQPANVLYSSLWEFDPDVRRLVIILPGANARMGALDYKIIPENRKVIAMEEAAARAANGGGNGNANGNGQ